MAQITLRLLQSQLLQAEITPYIPPRSTTLPCSVNQMPVAPCSTRLPEYNALNNARMAAGAIRKKHIVG